MIGDDYEKINEIAQQSGYQFLGHECLASRQAKLLPIPSRLHESVRNLIAQSYPDWETPQKPSPPPLSSSGFRAWSRAAPRNETPKSTNRTDDEIRQKAKVNLVLLEDWRAQKTTLCQQRLA